MRALPKIIAVDLDGTALSADHTTVLPRTASVLAACAQKGSLIVPCTGRSLCLFPPHFPPFRYAITSNGALISDTLTSKSLYTRCFSRKYLLAALDILSKYDVFIELFTDTEIVIERRVYENLDSYVSRIPAFHLPYLRSGHAITVDSLEEYVRLESPAVTKLNLPKRNFECCPEVLPKLQALGMFSIESDGHNLEVMCKSVSKGDSLARLANHLNIPIKEIAAFGDAGNDKSMLTQVGWGVAMGNATPEIKAAAPFSTLSNAEDGIAHFIENTFEI